MINYTPSLALQSLDKRFAAVREARIVAPPRGWLRAIREALGLTTRQMAARMGASPSRVTTLENAEVTGSTTIRSMREAAEALGCTFVYAIVPATSLQEMVLAQASRRAEQDLMRLHHSMGLENQAVDQATLAAERQRLVDERLAGPARRLWDAE